MSDPLDTVLRIRRVTVDDARRELAALLRAEELAQVKAETAEALIRQEGDAASDLSAGDDAVEAYAAWLPVGRANAVAARAAHEQIRCEIAMARAALTVARGAAESAQQLLDTRATQRKLDANRRDQAVLDEMALRKSTYG